jgi:ubiquinone/menaquinone biosynthesis C-methylase UbiE
MDKTPSSGIDPSQMFASPESAARWAETRAERDERFHEATELMLDLANIQPGNRVLDVAAGTGDQTLAAARRVGPTGYVLATDISPSMLELAAAGARQAGLANVETRMLDARQLDLPPDSFNAAISRQGLMMIPNRAAALTGIRSALRPGGRLAAVVHAAPEKNPYHGLPQTIAAQHCHVETPTTDDPGMFALGSADVLAGTFQEAGFREVTVRSVPHVRRFPTLDALVAELRKGGIAVLRPLLARLSEEEQEATWTEITAAMGQFVTRDGVAVPGEVLVGVGTK